MKEVKKLTDLSEKEVKFIVNEIFVPDSISDKIEYDKDKDEISLSIITTWGEEGNEQEIEDDVILRNPFNNREDFFDIQEFANYCIESDYPIEIEDFNKYKKFCYAKGIREAELEKDNPYIDKDEFEEER